MNLSNNIINDFKKTHYIKIPLSIITNKDLNSKRVLVLIYFLAHMSSFNNMVCFNLEMIIKYFNLKNPNKNSKFKKDIADIIKYLFDNDYLYKNNLIETSSILKNEIITCYVNTDRYNDERFALIYLDDIYKIINYKNNKNNNQLKIYMFLLLSYIRIKIPIRTHESFFYIEAYNGFYKNISDELGNATYKYISESFNILQELEIIYHEQIKRFKNKQGYWINAGLVFANMYKRIFDKNNDDTYEIKEISSGEDYYKKETDRKIKSIYNYYYKTSKPLN